MAVKKIVEPTVTDVTMADIIALINDKFKASNDNMNLKFDSIQLQLKLVTTDVADLRDEVKGISARLIVIDKEDAIHYLACPNTLLAPELKTVLVEFPKVKIVTDELAFMRKWFKPALVGTMIGMLVTMISAGIVIFKVQPEVNALETTTNTNTKNIQANTDALTEEQLRQINGILHKQEWDKENTTIKP